MNYSVNQMIKKLTERLEYLEQWNDNVTHREEDERVAEIENILSKNLEYLTDSDNVHYETLSGKINKTLRKINADVNEIDLHTEFGKVYCSQKISWWASDQPNITNFKLNLGNENEEK